MTMLRIRRTDGTVVQVVLALVLAVIVAVTLWWGFVREHAPLGPPGIRVEADFTAMPNGPAPNRFDGGQPATVVAKPDAPGDQLRIEHGRLIYRPITHGVAAAFLSSPDLGSSVKGIGARFVFQPGSGSTMGAITLVVSRGIDKRVPPMITPVAINFVVTAINWNIAVARTETSLEVVAADSFKRPLRADGVTPYEARLTIDGAQVTVDLPGTHRIVTDPRFSEWQGSFATFELYSNHGTNDSIGAFEKIWATGNKD
jgi:hypothetical protein